MGGGVIHTSSPHSSTDDATLMGSLEPSATGPTVRRDGARVPIFVPQTDPEISAGALCLLAALLAVGAISRDRVEQLLHGQLHRSEMRLISWLRRDYLVGTDVAALRLLQRRIAADVQCTYTRAKRIKAQRWITLGVEAPGRWMVVGLEGPSIGLQTWALVVGYARREDCRHVGPLFLLDPCGSRPPDRCWNRIYSPARANKAGYYAGEASRGVIARLSCAISLWRPSANSGRSAHGGGNG
jgi:hypothetical protein